MRSTLRLLIIACIAVIATRSALAQADPAHGSHATLNNGLVGEPAENSSDGNIARLGNTLWPSPVADEDLHLFLLSEILEYRLKKGDDEAAWDVFGWVGGDYNRLWVKSEGTASTAKRSGDADLQLLYGHLISAYFDLQAGVRVEQVWDGESDHSRGFLALGVQGLAPHYFDVEPTLFLSQDGDLSARATVTYDILLSQRLILQPRLEGNAASRSRKDFGVGSGVNNLEAGLRLRYEITREFAPYIGINWSSSFGETADLLRSGGEQTSARSLVAGFRIWF